jgi:hypothetical protein
MFLTPIIKFVVTEYTELLVKLALINYYTTIRVFYVVVGEIKKCQNLM